MTLDPTLQSRIASRIDGFVERDPTRPVDLWAKSSMLTVHREFLGLLDIPKEEEFSVLDAGCGVGHLCDTFADNGYDMDKVLLTGFDLSPKAIETAKKLHPNQDWLVASFVENFPTGTFDYTVCAGAFCYNQGKDHWSILDQQLQALKKATSKKGIGYLLYTDDEKWKPKSNHNTFVRFHPSEVKSRYPELTLVVNEDRMKASYGSGFADLDIYYIIW